MRIRTAFCIGLALLATACRTPSERHEYEFRGQILSMKADHAEANIKHDDIKGFMSAMTMSYHVRDPKEFQDLVAGDLIAATLVVVSNDAFLEGVKKIGNAPIEAPAATPAPTASSGFELLKPGESVPPGRFLNQDGKAVTLESFKGKTIVLTFIYTTCPMPTFCPLMDRHFATIQSKLKANKNENVHLLSVSFDPLTDTPAVLKKHAHTLGADPALWTFLTGDRDEIDQWASRFGVSVSRALNDPRDITHNLRTAILDGQGRIVRVYTGNEWTPNQILEDIATMGRVD